MYLKSWKAHNLEGTAEQMVSDTEGQVQTPFLTQLHLDRSYGAQDFLQPSFPLLIPTYNTLIFLPPFS